MSYSLDYDIIVNDDACMKAAQEYKNMADKFNTYLATYSDIIERILSDGISSGKVHNNLEEFSKSIDALKNQITDLSDTAEKCANGFVADMDKADSYLY